MRGRHRRRHDRPARHGRSLRVHRSGTAPPPRLGTVLVEREIVLPVPLEEAWTVLMDWERQADWMLDADSVTVVSDEREGVGVRLAVRTRILGVPAFTEPMEVVAWDPPRRLDIRHGSVVTGTGTWLLDPIEGGTRFTWREDIRLAAPARRRAGRDALPTGDAGADGPRDARAPRPPDRHGPGPDLSSAYTRDRTRGARGTGLRGRLMAPATRRT